MQGRLLDLGLVRGTDGDFGEVGEESDGGGGVQHRRHRVES